VDYLKLKLKYTEQLEKISGKLSEYSKVTGSSVSSDKLKAEEDALLGVLKEVETDFKDGKIKEVDYLKLKLKYTEQLEKIKEVDYLKLKLKYTEQLEDVRNRMERKEGK
jgi:hypothetical protein